MRRMQVQLSDEIWEILSVRSREQGITIPELVHQALREKYGSSSVGRRKAMQAVVGLWKNREDLPDTDTYVRRLRKGKRRAKKISY